MTSPVNDALLRAALEHLIPFSETLAGSVHAVLQWRVLPEAPGLPADAKGVGNRRGPITSGPLLRWLLERNQAGHAVYVSVNEYPDAPITGRGAGRKGNIVRVRAAHADLDIAKGHCPTGWTHEDVAGSSPRWPAGMLPPSMQVRSGGGPHLYWVYRQGEEPTVPRAEGINRAVSQVLHSDPAVFDAARILRAPGFQHWKTGEPRLVEVVYADRLRVYSADELSACLSSLAAVPIDTAQRAEHHHTPDGDVEPVEMSDEEYQRAVRSAVEYIRHRPITPKGQRGSALVRLVCPKLHDYGLRTPDALKLLRAWADMRCDPTPSADGEWPATDDMLRDRWLRSAGSRDSPRGSQVYEWRAGSLVDAEEAPRADRQAKDADAGSAPRAERQATGDDGGNPPPPPPPPPPGGDDDAPGGDDAVGREEPAEDWIEAQRLERAIGNTVPIPVRRQHRRTVDDVLAVLAANPALYQFDGDIVHLQQTTTGWRIRPLTRHNVTTYITDFCSFFRWKWKEDRQEFVAVDCGPPGWLAGEVIDAHTFARFRHLKGLTMMPRICADGQVSTPGYDVETATVYIADEDIEPVNVGETREAALEALAFLFDVIADFPLATPEHRAAAVGMMLTPFVRRAQNGPAPMFMVDGNRPNIGKSNLLRVVTSMHDNDVMQLNWAPPDKFGGNIYQNTQRISSAFQAGRTILALDNLKGAFGDEVIDKLLTMTHWSERILGSSATFTAENHMTVLGTANNVVLISDVWRRVIPVRLMDVGDGSRPMPRHELGTYLPSIRRRLVEACLTILRAHALAGRPCTASLMGSFENWSRHVAGALTWLGLPDITTLVATPEEAMEDTRGAVERESLVDAVERVTRELGKDEEGISAQELCEALEKERVDPYVVDKRFQTLTTMLSRHNQAITRDHVSALLKRHRDNTIRMPTGGMKMLVNVKDPGRRKSSTWKVVLLPGSPQPATVEGGAA